MELPSTSDEKEFKHVLHFLWSWCEEKGFWAKLLLEYIMIHSSLDDNMRNDVYQAFLHNIGLFDDYQEKEIRPPDFDLIFDNRPLKLQSITNVNGVNKLAKNQNLNFSDNLTVVYGKNASGKTGYSRILKHLGMSYDKYNKILSNVFNQDSGEINAQIDFNIDGENKIIIWKLVNVIPELSKMAIFNNNCVHLSLSNKRELFATPLGFELFGLMKQELNQLLRKLNEDIESKILPLRWFEKLHKNSEIKKFISELSHTTSIDEINKISIYKEKHQNEIKELEKRLENFNIQLINKKIEDFNMQRKELIRLYKKIERIALVYHEENIDSFFNTKENFIELSNKKVISLSDIAKEKGVEFYHSPEFHSFISSAEDYILLLGNDDYPGLDDFCVYCRQPISKEAQLLIKNYRNVLKSTLQNEYNEAKKLYDSQLLKFVNIDCQLNLNHSPFGIKNSDAIIPSEIAEYFNKINSILHDFKKNQDENILLFKKNIDPTELLESIVERYCELNIQEGAQQSLLVNLSKQELEINNQINELEDLKLFNINRESIKEYLNNLKFAHKLDYNKNIFNATSLSAMSTKARDFLIESRFEEIFNSEKRKLRCPDYVNINFGTSDSKPELRQTILDKYNIGDILSEGEQKSIALAEFITELELAGQVSPVIFDDPVTSLDHERQRRIAKRLYDLSKKRQVIVFTHSILLFYAFEQINEKYKKDKVKVEYQYYSVEYDEDFTGYLYKETPQQKETYNSYIKKVNTILNLSKEERIKKESQLAIDGYNSLRAAIELLVEDHIFKGTIKRYKRNISMGALESIDGKSFDIIKEELNQIFEQACGFIEAHSNPPEESEPPSLTQLKDDLDRVKDIYEMFKD